MKVAAVLAFAGGCLMLAGCDTSSVERYFTPPIQVNHEMRNTADLDNHMRCRMGYPMPDRSWETETASENHPFERDMCGIATPRTTERRIPTRAAPRVVIDNGK